MEAVCSACGAARDRRRKACPHCGSAAKTVRVGVTVEVGTLAVLETQHKHLHKKLLLYRLLQALTLIGCFSGLVFPSIPGVIVSLAFAAVCWRLSQAASETVIRIREIRR